MRIKNKVAVAHSKVSSQRLYDCASVEEKGTERKNYCYCRASSVKQRDDLERQAAFLTDVGSGLNFKRKQLLYLIEECLQGRVGRVVVAYRDRLCRAHWQAHRGGVGEGGDD